jgi:hypothetical protein
MKAKIISPTIHIENGNYGFAWTWTLDAFGRQFYLGQDVKFCSRVLGMQPAEIVAQIGSNDLREDKTRQKLARFILRELNINSKNVAHLQSWDLCAE